MGVKPHILEGGKCLECNSTDTVALVVVDIARGIAKGIAWNSSVLWCSNGHIVVQDPVSLERKTIYTFTKSE